MTAPCKAVIVIAHTVTQTTIKSMRTLKAVLCLSALAAGVATTMAQSNVYSLNVVGYVNVPVAAGYNLLANPLKAGVTNGANEIMPVILDEVILTWNGAGYDYVTFDGFANAWTDANGNPGNPPVLPPGKGFFFFNPGAATTFTFVGEVVPAPGATNSLALPAGYSLIGSPLPASGTSITAAPISMPEILDMTVLSWTGAGYSTRVFDGFSGSWVDGNGNPAAVPSYNVGQGFFLFNPGAPAAWKQNLP